MALHKLQYYQKNQETLQVVENMTDLDPSPDSLYGRPRRATQGINGLSFSIHFSTTFPDCLPGWLEEAYEIRDMETPYK